MSIVRIERFLIRCVIVFSPLEIYRVEVGGLPISLSRLFLFIALLVFIIHYGLQSKRLIINIFVCIVLLYVCVPLILGAFRFTNLTVLELVLASVVIFLIVVYSGNMKDHQYLLRSFQYSYMWYVFFGLYTYYIYFICGTPIVDVPFREYIPFQILDPGHIERGFVIGGKTNLIPRLALPLTSPPATSMSLVLGFLIFAGDKSLMTTLKLNIVRYAMMVFMIILIFMTVSKAGIILLFFVFFMLFTYEVRSKNNAPKILPGVLIAVLFVLVIVYIYLPHDSIVARLFVWSEMENTVSGHYDTRIHAINVVLSDSVVFFLGGGYGNYWMFGHGPHSHSPITTNLVELGILGSVFFWALYLYAIYGLFVYNRNNSVSAKSANSFECNIARHYYIGMITIIVGSFMYESITNWPFFIFVALSYSVIDSLNVR